MTIEERAKEYALKKCGGKVQEGTKGMIYSGAYNEYVKIATEQQKIDIDKACECFMKELTQSFTIPCGMTNIIEEHFRKAMKE